MLTVFFVAAENVAQGLIASLVSRDAAFSHPDLSHVSTHSVDSRGSEAQLTPAADTVWVCQKSF